VAKDVAARNVTFRQVSIYAVLTDLTGRSRSVTLEQPANDAATIKRNVRDLLEKFLRDSSLELRRVGVRVSGFSKEGTRQRQLTSFFQQTAA